MVNHAGEAKPLDARVQDALRNSYYRPLVQVQCELRDGVVHLRGRLPSFYLKQVAQTLAARSLGGRAQIENRIEVDAPRSQQR